MSNSILVVAAHSDDEVLGCGGTIARHIADGDSVTVVFMTNGTAARGELVNEADDYIRHSAAVKAMAELGCHDIRQFDFPDNKMDSIALLDIVQELEKVISEVLPITVYTHFAGDLNVDHQVTHKAVMTACRPQAWSSVCNIFCFEVLSATEWNSINSPVFIPQLIVDISSHWDKKVTALKCYSMEMRAVPHSRSFECVEALATLRGQTHGLDFAEAFTIERMIK